MSSYTGTCLNMLGQRPSTLLCRRGENDRTAYAAVLAKAPALGPGVEEGEPEPIPDEDLLDETTCRHGVDSVETLGTGRYVVHFTPGVFGGSGEHKPVILTQPCESGVLNDVYHFDGTEWVEGDAPGDEPETVESALYPTEQAVLLCGATTYDTSAADPAEHHWTATVITGRIEPDFPIGPPVNTNDVGFQIYGVCPIPRRTFNE
jgi:hypothetical protein